MAENFVLLDDCASVNNTNDKRSRLYVNCKKVLSCQAAEDIPIVIQQMQRALAQGQYAVCLFSYELGAQLQGVAHLPSAWPLAQILLFEDCERMDSEQVKHWLAAQEARERVTERTPVGIANLRSNVDEREFTEAIEKIRSYIEAGDTYQVNYTYRLRCDAFGSVAGLYGALRARQPVPYGALITLPDGRAVVSLSPELFLRHEDGTLTAQPMKGTTAASGDASLDAARAQALANDEKNRAENLMIVDLLRNDLGRIAEFGSVQVPALYEVTRYGGVLQMTSTIHARLRATATLDEIFNAVYPCGSITGAPKKRTMEIIREVEPDARGLYTGAIGWVDPVDQSAVVPNFCLSVPIRTLTLQAPDTHGMRRGEFGVGAGIVFDSQPADEYAECALKARFMTALPQSFSLFETMRVTRDGCSLIERHFARMRRSADYFGLVFDQAVARDAIQAACKRLSDGAHRLRMALGSNGLTVETAALSALAEPVRIMLATTKTQSNDLFLQHKTTVREHYDAAWRAAEAQGAFDMLFCNQRGELTEGGRCNVLLKLDGAWFTPPLSAGVLPGVMRSVLLEDSDWKVQKRTLTLEDLRRAERIAVCNALRGVLMAEVV
ncbi:MAG: aminodeoxychorismate synthase component I [Oxalobacter sp.]|nr:MAG: aminodeoxychorismate synthase component I [Oxalobacter sp.]